MGQSQRLAKDCADTVITNALVIDWWGIVKCDIAIKDGRIAKLGKAGNPDIQPGIDIVIGAGTEIIAGEGMIVTAGGIDSHIHFICPQQIDEALMSGVTTMIGGGTGPATGTFATTCTPGPWHIHRMLEAAEAFPMNLGFLGKGNASLAAAAGRADRGGRDRPEAARRLGHDARRDRRSACGRRPHGRAGRDPHRYAERIRIRRDDARCDRGAHDPHLSHRRRGRRPRAGHHQGLRRAERAAVVDQSDAAVHHQHHRRAPRHADGLPSPRSRDRRGRRIRRIAHSPRDDRRRGHPARPRRVLDALVGFAGDGPRRRGR